METDVMQATPAPVAQQPPEIAPVLLAQREWLNLDRAHSYLAGRLRARTPLGAAEYLELKVAYPPAEYKERLRIAISVCDLYRRLFARQSAASQSPLYSLPREQEFYILVDRHLFSLGGDVAAMIRRDLRLPCITVKNMQEHTWLEGQFDFQRIETVYKVAQVLSHRTGAGGRGWQALSLMFGLDCPPPAPPLCAVGWQLFSYACAVDDSPLRWLPMAFHVTNYSTQSIFLDLPPGAGFGYEWTGENVAKLLLHRRRAGEILASVTACDEWLMEAPRERIARVVEHWNKASAVEAQSPYAGFIGQEGQMYHVPGMGALYQQMERQ